MAKAELIIVPIEILTMIGRLLTDQSDMAALARTCRLFNELFDNILYRHNVENENASCLKWAATKDNMKTLIKAIKAGARLEDHRDLICVAATNGSEEVTEALLLTPGLDLMAENHQGKTPLALAATFGHTDVFKKLVEHGADISVESSDGWTPMCLACCHGRFDIVKLLLEDYGASMECDRKDGWSALRCAANYGHTNIMSCLLERGADVNVECNTGWTPMHAAADGGFTDAVRMLLDYGSDPEFADQMGWTPLTIAADNAGHDTVLLLLEYGANIEQRCTNMWTALCLAADRGDLRMIKILLDNGANIAVWALRGLFPLSLAAAKGHRRAVDLLLNHGADIHKATHKGWTPLITAADGGHATTVKLLIERGANIETKSTAGLTALFCAINREHAKIVAILLAYGANCMTTSATGWTPGIKAADLGSLRIIEHLIKIPAFDVDYRDKTGRSAFFYAALRGHTGIVKRLLPLTAMANGRDRYGTTPIFAAARNGHRDVVQVLIEEGYANFQERDFLGCTLFTSAQRSMNKQLISYLQRYMQEARIEIQLNDPTSKLPGHEYDSSKCLCDVCCRSSVHYQQSYVCSSCNRLIICQECIIADKTCGDREHAWRAHQCSSNGNFGVTPDYFAAEASVAIRAKLIAHS
ncbi:ankyrin repeat-containing domain [Trichoderma cornu-damae]|uniref:Ankyrin repeat-containing domain n=1 Tax=Trichoderma cornu-damae TaxID=654480 RepID=A0A9P8QIP2_9HYPO|nr:ankyrin repeat-containing domain [Trichoderma cornu-damae]